jgi:lantibiotic modifying enzyme
LYALLFVNKYVPSSPEEKPVTDEFIKKIVSVLIKEGMRSGKPHLYYEWHDKCYIGAGHGILGIIQILLTAMQQAPDSLNHTDLYWIRKTLDWLLTIRFPSGNMPSSLESKSNDRLIHWCHGASGAIWTWLLASKVFSDESYLAAAEECAEVIWDRGLLKKGYSLCHGVASSAYGLMAAYIYTEEEKYLERAYLFTRWCFDYGTKAESPPDRPLSLFEGMAGVIYMLADFGWNDTPAFPAFVL